jgi:hypothetical protein
MRGTVADSRGDGRPGARRSRAFLEIWTFLNYPEEKKSFLKVSARPKQIPA